MIFEEPRVEFVEIDSTVVTTDVSNPDYETCASAPGATSPSDDCDSAGKFAF